MNGMFDPIQREVTVVEQFAVAGSYETALILIPRARIERHCHLSQLRFDPYYWKGGIRYGCKSRSCGRMSGVGDQSGVKTAGTWT